MSSGEAGTNLALGAPDSGHRAHCVPRSLLTVAVMAVLAALGSPGTVTATGATEATVELRVWQDTRDETGQSIFVSARPELGSWATLGTIPLPLTSVTSNGRFRYGDIRLDVNLPALPLPAGIELRVWQSTRNSNRIYVSARPVLGTWAALGTVPLPLDDGLSSNGRFRYGDISLDVPLPPVSDVTVAFYGEFSPERRTALREEALQVVSYFSERYGIFEPEFELYFGADPDGVAQAQREILGVPDPSYVVCGTAVEHQAFLADWCATGAHDLSSPLAREYFRVLQVHLIRGGSPPRNVYVPDWLLEGTAEHFAFGYSIHQGHTSVAEVKIALQRRVIAEALDLRVPEGIPQLIPQLDTAGNRTAAFAVQHLASRSSEAALIEFFRLIPMASGWEEAFTTAFELTPSAFATSLAERIEAITPDLRNVHVTILGPDGRPLAEWNGFPLAFSLFSYGPVFDLQYYRQRGELSEEGGAVSAPDGIYLLDVTAVCKVTPGAVFAYRVHLAQPDSAVVVDGHDVSVTVALDGWPDELNIICMEPDYQISGRVVGEAGDVRGGYLLAFGHSDPSVHGALETRTDDTGAFRVDVPDGFSYTVNSFDSCGKWIGPWNRDEGVIRVDEWNGRRPSPWERETPITVDGASVSGIEIVVPASDKDDQC